MRKGDFVDVQTSEQCIHAVVLSTRASRIAVVDTHGRRYSFPKHCLAKVVRPFAGSDIERSALKHWLQ